jgi:hypothetical protein
VAGDVGEMFNGGIRPMNRQAHEARRRIS